MACDEWMIIALIGNACQLSDRNEIWFMAQNTLEKDPVPPSIPFLNSQSRISSTSSVSVLGPISASSSLPGVTFTLLLLLLWLI